MPSIRLDRFAPSWAIGIAEDLDAGTQPAEALRNASLALHHEANKAALAAIRYRRKFVAFQNLMGIYIGSDWMAQQARDDAEDALHYARYLRDTAAAVLRMQGRIIMGTLS